MDLSDDDKRVLHESEHYKSLLEHPGFRLLIECSQKAVLDRWQALLNCDPRDTSRIQGFIEGANYVLEKADAGVSEARILVAERDRENRERTEQALANARTLQRTRSGSRHGVGASLD